MKTYAEENEEEPFDWNEWLEDAMQGKHSFADWEEANELAEDWVTCACGSQCAVIPRTKEGNPLDLKLMMLGVKFSYLISQQDYYGAKETLAAIERRSTQILAGMGVTA